MSTRNRAQALEVFAGRNFHAKRVAIRLFFQGARLLAHGISALSWFPNHCYFQSSCLILLPNWALPYRTTFYIRRQHQALPTVGVRSAIKTARGGEWSAVQAADILRLPR